MYKIIGLLVFAASGYLFLSMSGQPPYPSQPDFNSCVKVYDAGRQANDQKAIRFYNGCPVDLYFNACVVSYGETKLYQSPRTVPSNGNWTILTFPNVDPRQVKWNAGEFRVPPPPC